MGELKGTEHTCSRGHLFTRSSDRPVCPECWPGYYRKNVSGEFPPGLSAPAIRALDSLNINSLAQLTTYSEADLLALHGFGPKGLRILKAALKAKGLALKQLK